MKQWPIAQSLDQRVGSLKKINKTNKSSAKLTKRKKKLKSIQSDVKGEWCKLSSTEIQRIIWNYLENLYFNKLRNVEEIDKFQTCTFYQNESREYRNLNQQHATKLEQ